MITCTKRYIDIPFAHRQPAHSGHCAFIHGHNWSFEFEFIARELDECGFVIDFGKLQPLKNFLSILDHALVLNHTDPLVKDDSFKEVLNLTCGQNHNVVLVPDCSCEGLADYALKGANKIVSDLTEGRVTVGRCTVFEDSKNSATSTLLP